MGSGEVVRPGKVGHSRRRLKRQPKRGRGRRWLGGYIHHEADGSELFIIERQVNGQRFHVSTRCNDEETALEHFARFRADPLGYDPAGVQPDEPVEITVDLLAAYLDYQITPRSQGGRENTPKYAREAVRHLGDWMVKLKGRDLRKTKTTDLKLVLAKWKTARQHRIVAIKAFCTWLREERGSLQTANDPTLDLVVPQLDPTKHVRRKVADWGAVMDVYARLNEKDRDVLQALTATGWHVTELQRFIRRANCTIEKPGVATFDKDGLPVLAVLVTWHKTKKWTRTSIVHQRHLDAITRLKASGEFVDERRVNRTIRESLEAADADRKKIDPTHQPRRRFTLGVMRHSVATWGIELGGTVAESATHLDHADKRTTERFYADVMVPKPPIRTRTLDAPDERTVN